MSKLLLLIFNSLDLQLSHTSFLLGCFTSSSISFTESVFLLVAPLVTLQQTASLGSSRFEFTGQIGANMDCPVLTGVVCGAVQQLVGAKVWEADISVALRTGPQA
ncbi:hypothetical protein FGO68_gene7302 [Halteria grandinella]|uniref:Uncharacterized protein n=1 Tax=Halteria grandinella TaxID=5974 RepID=A0A8J8NV97_HALGN|nr:hypothetical protein FGO68_gene7302 [Halteria grandinella]